MCQSRVWKSFCSGTLKVVSLRIMIDYVHSIILSYVDCNALWLFDDAKGGEKWGGIEA